VKKIIAVILTVSFLAVTPAQADGPDRPAQAAGQDGSEKADRQDRTEKADRPEKADRQDRPEKADRQDREDVTTPSIVGGILTLTQSVGGGIPCCLV
jgi:Ni/Co efflux regulator RcnB